MAVLFAVPAESMHRWELPNVGTASTKPTANPANAANAATGPTVRELAQLQEQARAEGYAAGRAEGLAAGQQQIREHVAQLDALLAAVARPLDALDAQTAQELTTLALTIAKRVLRSELTTTPELVVRAVQTAVAALPSATQELQVHVHPDDLVLVRDAGVDGHWQAVADPGLTRGGCRLEAARSHLDATVETRLAAVIDAVLGDEAPATP